MSLSIPAKDDITTSLFVTDTVPLSMMTRKAIDPDFTREKIEQHTEAFLRAGGKVQQVPQGATAFANLSMRQVHDVTAECAGISRGKGKLPRGVDIVLTTTKQRDAKERKAQQQWKEIGA